MSLYALSWAEMQCRIIYVMSYYMYVLSTSYCVHLMMATQSATMTNGPTL